MKALRLLVALPVLAVAGMVFAPEAHAQPGGGQGGGQGGLNLGNLIGAILNVQANIQRLLNDNTLNDVDVVDIDDSLNNTRVLNRNPILSNNIITLQNFLQNFLNSPGCSVIAVCNSLNNALRDAEIDIEDVVAIEVLSDGTVVVFYDD